MATIAVSHTGFTSEKVVPFGARTDAHSQVDQPTDSAMDREIDVAARLLCALSTHASLREAMMSYHAELPGPTALHWTEQVLRRMEALLPSTTASDLSQTYDYNAPWIRTLDELANEKLSLMTRLALPAVVTSGIVMFAMFVVGVVTTFHYVLSR